jgi:flagellar hook protein FlgE
MFKSLYSGVSGLGANLTNLDVIGNNIANSNTVGFKTGRVTFNEMLTQTIKSASRPVSGGLGGTNPQQVGLGTQVGSIDTNFNQGNFRTTGKKTDLAIQGAGFFILNNGESNVYTRAGIFGLDSQNTLVNPATGMRVQGVMADDEGVMGTGALTDIVIDPTLVVPAQASTSVSLMGNLDSSSDATATIMESPVLLAAADGDDLLTELSGQGGSDLDLRTGDVVNINGHETGVATDLITESFTVGVDGDTLNDLLSWLNGQMTTAGKNITFTIPAGGNGEIVMENNDSDIEAFSLSSTGKTAFNSNFTFPSIVASGTSESSNELRAFATETDRLEDLYDNSGNTLGIDFTATNPALLINGDVGGESVTERNVTIDTSTTLGDVMQEFQFALGINSNPVELSDGQIVVTGEVGTEAAIGTISLAESGIENTALQNAFGFNQVQEATDRSTYSMSTTVYDSLGGEHTVSFTFEKVPGQNEWIWTAAMEGGETILDGGTGRVNFSENGSISNFSFDGTATALSFDPNASGGEGAENVTLAIDYGEIGALTGLTQFEGSGNLQSIADGYGTGTLVDFNIDQSGIITGIFSNDTMRDIAQIAMATFSNPDGLTREANNTYRRSGNSGQAVETFAGSSGITLVPGALETSNVDLAAEFTNLVTAQRAFQANSRVITTSDQVMQELVNLVR